MVIPRIYEAKLVDILVKNRRKLFAGLAIWEFCTPSVLSFFNKFWRLVAYAVHARVSSRHKTSQTIDNACSSVAKDTGKILIRKRYLPFQTYPFAFLGVSSIGQVLYSTNLFFGWRPHPAAPVAEFFFPRARIDGLVSSSSF